jgi:hypothetical protein
MIFSLTDTIQDIILFLTLQFCRDREFRAMKTRAQTQSPFLLLRGPKFELNINGEGSNGL